MRPLQAEGLSEQHALAALHQRKLGGAREGQHTLRQGSGGGYSEAPHAWEKRLIDTVTPAAPAASRRGAAAAAGFVWCVWSVRGTCCAAA